MTTRTLPTSIADRARWAIGHLDAWNSAILQARAMEALVQQPGRYEYDLRTGETANHLSVMRHQATMALDALEDTAAKLGWSRDDFYTALGAVRPALEPEGDHVVDWFQGSR